MDNDILRKIQELQGKPEADLSVFKTKNVSTEELKAQMARQQKEYYLVSEDFSKHFECDKSLPIDRYGDTVRVIHTDWKNISSTYDSLDKNIRDIWAREITQSYADLEIFDLETAKKIGLFTYIEWQYGATTEANVSAIIGQLANEYAMNPIEFINQFSKK